MKNLQHISDLTSSHRTPEFRQELRLGQSFELDNAQTRDAVRDLLKVNPSIYWIDLLLSAAVGWSALVAALVLRPWTVEMLACVALAALALYRALCFIHEISHQNGRTLPGFETAWNWFAGYGLLMPSFVYVGVHQNHHKLSTYGTAQDPEYLPFARSSRMTTVFALEGFFIPTALLFRFLFLTPVGLISPRFQRWLVVYASALTMNVKYRREATAQLVRKVRIHSAAIFVVWAALIAAALRGVVPWRFFILWFVVVGIASAVNTVRTLGAHAYESSGEPLDRHGQLVDSIDTPGGFWTELWAPVGLRYHALHHYLPGIPYHSLPEAYRRLVATPPSSASYRKLSSPSLRHSLVTLFKKGLRNPQ
jgi:fatty acid desaturase